MLLLHIFNIAAHVLILSALMQMLNDNTYKKWLIVVNIFMFAAACAVNIALAIRSFM